MNAAVTSSSVFTLSWRRPGLLWISVLVLSALVALRLWLDLSSLSALAESTWRTTAALQLQHLYLPRLLSALLAGAALGVSGAVLQALTRNVLAAPDLLGITGGAQLGLIVLLLLPGLSTLFSPLIIFVCSMLAAVLVYLLAGGLRASMLRLIVSGTACSLMFGAIISLLLVLNSQSVVAMGVWSSGILYQGSLADLAKVAIWTVPALALLIPLKKPLEAMQLGIERAQTLGVPLSRVRLFALLSAVAFSAVAVSLAGPVGFIGLLAPNLVRLCGRHRLPTVLGLSALWGAFLLLLADTLVVQIDDRGRLFNGTLIAMLGTPVMLWLVLKNASRQGRESSRFDLGGQRLSLWRLLPLVLALLVLPLLGALAGTQWLSLSQLLAGLSGQPPFEQLLSLRLPRVELAAVGGALLAASGVLMQSVIRNPLAGPEILGLTQGAALASLLMVLWLPGASLWLSMPTALAGGCGILFIALWLNRRNRFATVPLAITGIALSALCGALTQWIVVTHGVQAVQALTWLAGGSYGRDSGDVIALLPWCLLLIPLALLCRPLRLLELGEDHARSLGLNVARIRALGLLLAALLASAVVAVIGPVGFVGLIAPHIARLLGARSILSRLLVALPVGAVLLMLADLLGRSLLAPNEIPAGVMTAFLGAPYFLYLLQRHGRRQRLSGGGA